MGGFDETMELNKTSIIILAYKEPEKFKRMFMTLLKHTSQSRTPYEIVVVQNKCDPKISEFINSKDKDIATRIINPENFGTSAGFNQGASIATGHYLCFFNSDYYMNIGWLDSMIECFEHRPKIGLISCATNVTGNKDEGCSATINKFLISEMSADISFDYKESECAIAQMFTTKKIWEEVNGFNEEFFFGFEDLDFNEKIKKKGYKIFVNRKTWGYHDHNPALKKLDEGHQQMEKSRDIFRKKWGETHLWA